MGKQRTDAKAERGLPDKQRRISERSLANLKQHQWKPGQSGNPKGRPRRKTLTERIWEELGRPSDLEPGKTNLDVLIERLVREAIERKPWAFAEIADRLDPKPKRVELSGGEGGPVELTWAERLAAAKHRQKARALR